MSSAANSSLTQVRSYAARGSYSRDALKAIFRASPLAHCAYLHDGKGLEGPDGEEKPRLLNLPMLTVIKEYEAHGEEGDSDPEPGELVVYIHTYYGSRLVQAIKSGLESITISTTKIDGVVLGAKAKGHSVNYRSGTIYGIYPTILPNTPLGLTEKRVALAAVIDDVTGYERMSYIDQTLDPDVKSTCVIRVRIEDASCKQRTGAESNDQPPVQREEDDKYPGGSESHEWEGVIPCWTEFGIPKGMGRHGKEIEKVYKGQSVKNKEYAELVAMAKGQVDGR